MKTPTILIGALLLALATVGLLMPWYTRRDLFFGVTVSPEFRDTASARRLVRIYRAAACAVTGAALVILVSVQQPVIASSAALFAYVIGTLVVLVFAHHFALRYATPRNAAIVVDLSASPERLPGGLLAWLFPYAGLAGLGGWALLNISRLPPHLVLHWGQHGPDRWVATTPGAVAFVLGLVAPLCLILTLVALAVAYRSRRISTQGVAASSERQFRRRSLLAILAVEYLLAVLPLFIFLGAPLVTLRSWIATLWVTLAISVVALVRAGQGGTRLTRPMERTGAAPVGDRTDDANWLGGLLYVNRSDPALMVERRMGLGWTLNFGNPWAWALLAAVLVIPLAIRLVARGALAG